MPVAAAAVSLGKKALADGDDKKPLQSLAISSPNMKAAAESYARRVALKEGVLLKVYQPLARFLGVSREYFETDFQADLAGKLADIPEERLSTPSPSVAIPAMQGLAYSVDAPDLKDMYLSLLATATDERVKDDAHPSFAEIIKQLSPPEANLLLEVLRAEALPVVRLLRKASEGDGGIFVANHILALHDTVTHAPTEVPYITFWVDNWIRLRLIDVDYSRRMVATSRYDWAEERPEYSRLAEADPRGVESLEVERGVLSVTEFGARFLKAVSFDGVPIAGQIVEDDAYPD